MTSRRSAIQNMIQVISNPMSIGWIAFVSEAVLLDYELGLVLSVDLLELENHTDRHRIRDRYFIQMVGYLNIQSFLLKAVSANLVWAILLSMIALLALLVASLFMDLRDKRITHDYSFTWRPLLAQFQKSAVYYGGYLVYFVLIFASTFMLCEPTDYEQPVVTLSEELPILSTLAKSLTNTSEKRFTVNWKFDLSKECFGGEHIIVTALVLVVTVLTAVLRYLNGKLLFFYPDPRITDVRRNNLDLVHLFAFVLLFAVQRIILTLKLYYMVSAYYWSAFVLYLCIAMINVFSPPFFNKSLQRFKVYKYVTVLLSCVWITVIRMNQTIRLSKYFNQMSILISIGLLVSFSYKLLSIFLTVDHVGQYKDLGLMSKQLVDNNKIYDLIYEFEWMKLSLFRTWGSKDQSSINRQLLKFLRAAKDHAASCDKADCGCKAMDIFKKANRYDRLETFFEAPWLTTTLFIMNKLLISRLEGSLQKKADLDKRFKRSFRVWAMFTLNNFGNTKNVLSMLSKCKNGEISAKNTTSKKKLKWDNIDIHVLCELVSINMRDFEVRNEFMTWKTNVDVSQEVEPHKLTNHINLYPVIDYTTAILRLQKEVKQVSELKAEIIEKLSGGQTYADIVDRSNRYRRQIETIDGIAAELRVKSNVVMYTVNIIEVHYLRNVKEDLYSAKLKMNEVNSKTFTFDLGLLLKLSHKEEEIARSLVLSVSGEADSVHKIKQVCGDPSNLGHSVSSLLNTDLNAVLPYSVAEFHRELLSSSRSVSHYLERKEWLCMSARGSNGIIQQADISYRIDPGVDNGLSYMGLIRFKNNTEDQMSLILDEHTIIRDYCKVGGQIFRRDRKMAVYHPDLGAFLEKYTSAVMIFEFGLKDIYYENANLLKELYFSYESSQEMFDSWLPFGMVLDSTQGEESSYLIKMSLVKNFTLKRIVYNITLKANQQKETQFHEPISMFQAFFRSKNKTSRQSLDKMVTGSSDHVFSRISLKEEQISKFDFSSKYAQQTDDHQMPSNRNTTMRKRSSSSNNIDVSNRHIKKPDPSFHYKAEKQPSSHGIMNIMDGIADFAEKEIQKPDLQFERNGLEMKARVFDQIFENEENESSLLRNSRFIHHMINFKGLRKSVFGFTLPFILVFFGLIYQFNSETYQIMKFQKIGNDLVIIDSYEYLAWICFLQTQYMTVRRMIMEGYVADDQFSAWGIESMTERLVKIMQLPDLQGQFIKNTNRLRKGMFNSSYREYYDLRYVEDTEADFLTYIEGEGVLKLERMKAVDGMRYTQTVLNKVLAEPEAMHGIWGKEMDFSQSKLEAVVRHNNLNPIWKFVVRSSLNSSSF